MSIVCNCRRQFSFRQIMINVRSNVLIDMKFIICMFDSLLLESTELRHEVLSLYWFSVTMYLILLNRSSYFSTTKRRTNFGKPTLGMTRNLKLFISQKKCVLPNVFLTHELDMVYIFVYGLDGNRATYFVICCRITQEMQHKI